MVIVSRSGRRIKMISNDPIKTLIQKQSEVRCIDWLTRENGANKPLLVVGYMKYDW